MEAFDLDAVYYLVKPVTEEKLRTLVERFLRRQKKPVTKLTITTPVKDYVFPLQRVVKIQSNNKGVDIYLHGEPQPQRIPLSFVRVEEQLDEERSLSISLRQREGALLISLANSCPTGSAEFSSFVGASSFPSTKRDGGRHGLGLKSVQMVADKYGGSAEYKREGGVFTARVVLNVP